MVKVMPDCIAVTEAYISNYKFPQCTDQFKKREQDIVLFFFKLFSFRASNVTCPAKFGCDMYSGTVYKLPASPLRSWMIQK